MSMEVFELARVQTYSQRLLDINSRSTIALQGLALAALSVSTTLPLPLFSQSAGVGSKIMHQPAGRAMR